MASYVPLVKNSAGGWIGYIALQDFATPGAYKANPTIASGDFKVSIDGGALANLSTLPSVAPASSIWVLITLSQAEVNGDNIQIQCIDQTATKEWADYAFLLQTSTYTQTVAQTGDTYARVGAPAGASVSADVAAVKTDSAAVKVQTDKLVFSVTNQVDSNVIDWKGATAPAMTGDAYARIGALGAGLTAVDDAVITAIAALNNLSSANVSAAVLAAVVEGTETLQQNLRLVRAAAAGKLSGAAGTTVAIRDAADTKDRISATVDADGNRSAVTTDVT